MSEWKILSRCEQCRRLPFYIKRRKLKLPMVGELKSEKLICKTCITTMQKEITNGIQQV